jgi:hypothetical protein
VSRILPCTARSTAITYSISFDNIDKSYTISAMSGPSFNRDDICKFLAERGYTSNPEGLVYFFPHDYVLENEYAAYLDVNAYAVRKGDEVPDRPVRITFRKTSYGHASGWEVESVAELASGVQSKALDRDRDTPKVSPWPDKKKCG